MSKTQQVVGFEETKNAVSLLSEYDGLGLDDVFNTGSSQPPFLMVAQGNSAILKPGHEKYNEEVRQGYIYNNMTGEAYKGDPGVEIVVCHAQQMYTLWIPQNEGGGFRGIRPIDDPEIAELIREQGKFPAERISRGFDRLLLNDKGEQVVEQINLYVLYGEPPVTDENFQHAVVAFSSAKLPIVGKFRKDLMAVSTAPIYRKEASKSKALMEHRWRLSTWLDKRDDGDFFNFRINLAAGTLANPSLALIGRESFLFQEAVNFHRLAKGDQVKVNYDEEELPF